MMGTVVLDEIVVPIHCIFLEAGTIVIHARSIERVTCSVRNNAEVSVFSPDGTLIVHRGSTPGGRTDVTIDGHLDIHLPLVCHL